MEVYLVIGSFYYEGSSNIRAYKDKKKAEKFATLCNRYEKTREQYTQDVDDDKKFDAYCERFDKWRDAHPAKPHYDFDSYNVEEIKLY